MNRVRITAVACIASLCLAPCARVLALPGQTIAQFRSWAAPRPQLRGMTRITDETSGHPAFTVLTADHGIVWQFRAVTDGRSVQSEELGVGEGAGSAGSLPIRHDGTGYGIVFLRSLYGSALVADYLASSRIGTVADRRSHVVSAFYRGRRNGYELAGGFLTIASPQRVAADLALLQQCNARPESCNE